MKAEKPRSRVMPLSYDYGFLSNPAVDAIVLRLLQRLVLPESICPSTPIFIFNIYSALTFWSKLSTLII
jgi:hypothetical protein